MNHPQTFFGVCRHNTIIPLKLAKVKDFEDGYYLYTIEINHPNPTRHMIVHHEADFTSRYVSENEPLCDQYSRIRLTLEEAKDLAKQKLNEEMNQALRKIESLKKQINKIDESCKDLENL